MPLTVTNVVPGQFFFSFPIKKMRPAFICSSGTFCFRCDIIVLRGSAVDKHTQISCVVLEGHTILQNLNISKE